MLSSWMVEIQAVVPKLYRIDVGDIWVGKFHFWEGPMSQTGADIAEIPQNPDLINFDQSHPQHNLGTGLSLIVFSFKTLKHS